jgi:hypothetical protein
MKSITAGIFVSIILFASQPASAQWSKVPDKSIPRARDGKPNLSAPAPKAADGKPDLSGVWMPDNDPNGKPVGVEQLVFPRYFVDITADMKPETVGFQPWAAALFKERLQSQGTADPIARCKPTGVPAINSIPLPYKIVQMPKLILLLYEENTQFRQIFLDGRQPVKDAEPRWLGYSTGKWEGDTLVVDTVGFNDRHWLDRMGHPNSDALHVTERIRRRDVGHMDIAVTINDSKAYTKPITYTQTLTIVPDDDLLEYFCAENERDVEHFTK